MTIYCNDKPVAQGELLIIPCDKIAAGAKKVAPVEGQLVVGHSETGHHHVIDVLERPGTEMYEPANDEFTVFVKTCGTGADLKHLRPFDTHETVHLASDKIFMIKRQRVATPDGWKKAQD
jgi:hypothetical protein